MGGENVHRQRREDLQSSISNVVESPLARTYVEQAAPDDFSWGMTLLEFWSGLSKDTNLTPTEKTTISKAVNAFVRQELAVSPDVLMKDLHPKYIGDSSNFVQQRDMLLEACKKTGKIGGKGAEIILTILIALAIKYPIGLEQ